MTDTKLKSKLIIESIEFNYRSFMHIEGEKWMKDYITDIIVLDEPYQHHGRNLGKCNNIKWAGNHVLAEFESGARLHIYNLTTVSEITIYEKK